MKATQISDFICASSAESAGKNTVLFSVKDLCGSLQEIN